MVTESTRGDGLLLYGGLLSTQTLYLSSCCLVFLPARGSERTAGKQTSICLEEPGAPGEVIKIMLLTAERKPVINLTAPLIFSVLFATKHCLLAVSLLTVPPGKKSRLMMWQSHEDSRGQCRDCCELEGLPFSAGGLGVQTAQDCHGLSLCYACPLHHLATNVS